MTFSTISNFVVTFLVKGLVSDNILAVYKFTPFSEVRQNLSQQQFIPEMEIPDRVVDQVINGGEGLMTYRHDSTGITFG